MNTGYQINTMKCSHAKNFIVLFFFLASEFTGFVHAQDTARLLTLQDAVDLCIQNNKQLKLNQLNMDAFLYLGVLFLICVPFVLILLRKNKGGGGVDMSAAH